MAEAQVKLNNVNFTYQSATPLAYQALHDINLTIDRGSFTVLVGQTGSGKSTLVRLIDTLDVPTSGEIILNGNEINSQTPSKDLDQYRQKVGFVFQFPERQLFAQTVREDLEFGPRNLGWKKSKIDAAVEESLEMVQLSPELLDSSPFSLSGGQMRRVAIAGVLAAKPDILILDEPAVGLDSLGNQRLLKIITELNRRGITIIMITHYLEMITSLATQIVALHEGNIVFDGKPIDFLANQKLLEESQLLPPESIQISREIGLNTLPLTLTDLSADIAKELIKWGEKDE